MSFGSSLTLDTPKRSRGLGERACGARGAEPVAQRPGGAATGQLLDGSQYREPRRLVRVILGAGGGVGPRCGWVGHCEPRARWLEAVPTARGRSADFLGAFGFLAAVFFLAAFFCLLAFFCLGLAFFFLAAFFALAFGFGFVCFLAWVAALTCGVVVSVTPVVVTMPASVGATAVAAVGVG